MRKLSNTRSLRRHDHQLDTYATDTRQRRIAGATITARPESHDIDAFFARHRIGATVTGTGRFDPPDKQATNVVSLSDGTQIWFATAPRFDTATSI